MTRYIIARIGQALLVVLAAYTVAFFLLNLLPSNPVDLMLGPDAADVSAELALATIGSITVLGALHASPAVKAALADRIR